MEFGETVNLGEHKLICQDTTKFNITEWMNDKLHMVFTDPPYELNNHNWVKQLIQDETEVFIMHRDKAVVDIANENRKYFRYFYIVMLDPAWYIGNKTAFLGHTPIAYFRKGKTRFINHHDKFSTLIKPSSVKILGTHEKSVDLAMNFIKRFTYENQNVLDCFGGTGSTLIACEKLNRKCWMIESNPEMCEKIITRYWEFKDG